ncbi:MAG: hypothetical protein ACK40K_02820 [Raineya sp.]
MIRYLILFFLVSPLFAQSVFEDDFTKELTFGVNINTNGGFPSGINFKYGKITDNARVNTTYGIEIVGVRHPQEYRFSVSGLNNNAQSFVRGKANYLYSLRLQYGKDIILFRKAPQEGVQVNAVFAGGLSLGMLKPYMIRYDVSNIGGIGARTQDLPFYSFNLEDAGEFQRLYGVPFTEERVLGRGGFFQGFDQIKVVPGLNAKIGLAFEASAFKTNLTGAEVGFSLEVFSQKAQIMNIGFAGLEVKNYSTFAAMYLTAFFGARR